MSRRGRHRRQSNRRLSRKVSRASLALTAGGAGIALPLIGSGSAHAASVSTWDEVAQCESTGNWSINNGNGFYGGLQFTQSTWSSYGGTKYAPRADQATKDQQIAVAEKVLEGQGPKAWPLCGPKAGLSQNSGSPDISPDSASGDSGAKAEKQPAKPEKKAEAKPEAGKKEPQGSRFHTVARGDTLYRIATDEGVDGGWKKLYDANRETVGSDPDLILPGQKLTLKGGEAKAEPSAAKPQSGATAKKSSATKSSATKPSGDFTAPVSSGTSTPYGASGGSWSSGKHTGVDFSAPSGTSVKAVTSGTVVQAGWGGAYGNQVVLKHEDGKYSQYGHLSSLSVRPGQQVSVGDQIGASGSTGNSTGPHLHFEVRNSPVYGSDVDPLGYLRQHGVGL
ncbi:transglycosylase family protein [Streptomyces albidus (ex Kaewkla and Franco 2022)]|uniref:transglycosylase family protein n=1 Tax=Streptomyces albidus (ex Kaewkla and Franco 2022) TaxID=722709 RepID=UPI0015EECB43|nr:transglycosylase family protein [Streptomyces albidus (ex Kaewkla and Franco 2022)]